MSFFEVIRLQLVKSMAYKSCLSSTRNGTTGASLSVGVGTGSESLLSLPRRENAMKCDLCNFEATDGELLCDGCAAMIPPFALDPPTPGTELAMALAVELAPYLVAD